MLRPRHVDRYPIVAACVLVLACLPFSIRPYSIAAAVSSAHRPCLPRAPSSRPFAPRLASSIDGTGFAAAGFVGGLLTGSGRALCLPRDAAAGVFCGRWRGCLLRLFHRVAWCGSVGAVCARFPPCPVAFLFPPCLLRFHGAVISSVMCGSCCHRLGFSPYRLAPRLIRQDRRGDDCGGVAHLPACL